MGNTRSAIQKQESPVKGKQAQSRSCLKTVLNGNRGVISTQVIQEFHVTATRKLGIDPLISKEIIHSFSKFEIVLITPEIIDRAINCQIINRLSFWDALIMSAAESNRLSKWISSNESSRQSWPVKSEASFTISGQFFKTIENCFERTYADYPFL
jgi:predicted nucleic acid-binding protein